MKWNCEGNNGAPPYHEKSAFVPRWRIWIIFIEDDDGKGEKDDDAKAADMIEDQCNVLQNLFELQFLLLYFGFKSRETIQLLPALKIDHHTKRKNLNLVHIYQRFWKPETFKALGKDGRCSVVRWNFKYE